MFSDKEEREKERVGERMRERERERERLKESERKIRELDNVIFLYLVSHLFTIIRALTNHLNKY